ncbi:MAG: hypothetical protein K5866_04930 [Treponema sp.]|nr:hypothetical protein [Treponema sp.]
MKKIILIFLLIASVTCIAYSKNKVVKKMDILIDTNQASVPENMLWRGMGMVSGNNSSRLLLDYKSQNPQRYQELLELIFGEKGCGIQHLKIEMGADINSSSGTEPCTMRSIDEKADVTRGAAFILAADAKKINPDLTLDMLWWAEPLWIEREGGLKSGPELAKEKQYENRYKWYRENLVGAYEHFGLKFDFVSATQNERGWDSEWIKYLSNQLKSDSAAPYDFSKIKIVAGDEVCSWNQADLMASDQELFNAIDVIGSHYTSWSTDTVKKLRQKGKEVWLSEGSSPMGYAKSQAAYDGNGSGLNGLNGVLDVANRIITMYAQGKMTLYEFQPVIAAYYDGVTYCHKELISANTPWSGYYQLGPGFFMALHFSQFIKRGWTMLDSASFGDGHAAGDGHALGGATYSYLTGSNPESGDWSTVITNTTENPIEYTFEIKNGKKDQLWAYQTSSWKIQDSLKKSKISVKDGKFSIKVKANSIVSLSSLDINPLDDALSLSSITQDDNKILELPYKDDFNYSDKNQNFLQERGFAPLYTSDQGGAFEVINLEGQNLLQQKIRLEEKAREWGGSPEPVTNLGDDRWFNYSVQIEGKFSQEDLNDSNYIGIGGRYNLPDSGKNGIWLKLQANGKWQLLRNKISITSGQQEDFSPEWTNLWHKLWLGLEDMTVKAKIDDKEVLALNLADTKASLQGAGRVAIYSSYRQNCFKNLEIQPLGKNPYIERFDNLDSNFTYTENETSHWEHSLMDSFKCYKRTVSKGKKGSSCKINFTGSGFILTGTSDKGSGLKIKIDGQPLELQKIRKTENREALFYYSGLKEGKHKLEIKILAGNMNIDGLEVLSCGE